MDGVGNRYIMQNIETGEVIVVDTQGVPSIANLVLGLLAQITGVGTHEAAIAEVDVQRVIDQIMLESEDANTFEVARADLVDCPVQVLANLSEKFQLGELSDKLSIKFIGDDTVDQGGPSRQFICDLFEGLAKQLVFKSCSNGHFRPELAPGKMLDEAGETIYRQMGQLMMFCLNAADSYPIGMIFEDGMYAGIHAMSDDWLEEKFADLIDNPKNFDALLSLYEKTHSEQECAIKRMKQYLMPWNASTAESVVKTAYELVESDLPNTLQNCSCVQTLVSNGSVIQQALKKFYAHYCFAPAIAPLHAIAYGMKRAPFQQTVSWPEIQAMDLRKFQELLRGEVDIETIVEKIQFRKVPGEKAAWVTNWIRKSSEETRKQFLHHLTGSTGIGKKDIVVADGSAVRFDACFNMLTLPFSQVITSEELCHSILEGALKGEASYQEGEHE